MSRYDFVVFGAYGFTAKTVLAEICLSNTWKKTTTWAIAGRNEKQLKEIRQIMAVSPGQISLPDILVGDVDDYSSLVSIAVQSTRSSYVSASNTRNVENPSVCSHSKLCWTLSSTRRTCNQGLHRRQMSLLGSLWCAARLYLCHMVLPLNPHTGEPEFIERMYLLYNDLAKRANITICHAAVRIHHGQYAILIHVAGFRFRSLRFGSSGSQTRLAGQWDCAIDRRGTYTSMWFPHCLTDCHKDVSNSSYHEAVRQ